MVPQIALYRLQVKSYNTHSYSAKSHTNERSIMKTFKSLQTVLGAGLLVAGCLSLGCARSAERAAQAPVSAPAATNVPAAAATAAPEDTDPITRVAYKTGVARDKVEKILEIYAKYSEKDASGRDIYNIALAGSRGTGVPTDEVGSVILSYRSLFENGVIEASKPAKNEVPKG